MKINQIIKNAKQIVEGVTNTIFKKEHVEVIANERWKVCKTCPKLDRKGDQCVAPGSQPCCGDCGCSLAFKMRSLSSACPLGKWDAVLTEEEENILQEKINKNGTNI